jgi:hypothetical protein
MQQKAAPLRGDVLIQAKKPPPPSSTDRSRSSTACTPPPSTVVGWWPFDETVGPIADDIAGFQQNLGTYGPGGPTPAAGKVANALYFNGTSDYLTVADASEVDLSNRPSVGPFKFCSGFTIDAWVKTNQGDGVAVILDKRVNPAAPLGYSLFLANGQLGFQLADGTPPGSACGSPSTRPCTNYIAPPLISTNVATDTWRLIAVTVQAHGSATSCPEVGKLYVDVAGVMTPVLTFNPRTHSLNSGNTPGSDIANSANLYIGRRMPAFGAPGFFKGRIDELEFFNRANQNSTASNGALTQQQLQAIYNAGSAGKCK